MNTSSRPARARGKPPTYVLVIALSASCHCLEPLNALPAPRAVLSYGELSTPPAERVDVAMGAATTAALVLTNEGNAALAVASVRVTSSALCPSPSAALTIASWPTNVRARAAESIVVAFAPRDGAPACATLVVDSDDVAHPQLVALVTAQADLPALCTSHALVDFGAVPVGESRARAVTLTSCGTQPLTLLSMTTPSAPFGASTLAAVPQDMSPGASIDVDVTFSPVEARRYDPSLGTGGAITLVTDVDGGVGAGVGAAYRIELAGEGVVPPTCRLAAVPAVMQMGTLAAGAGRTTTQQLLLRNLGTLPCAISSVALDTDGSSSFSLSAGAPAALQPAEIASVDVTFAPTVALGVEHAAITIVSDDPATPLVVPVEGTSVEPRPCMLEASPTSLAFGLAGVGHTTTRSFTLRNVGTASCRLGALELSSGAPQYALLQAAIPVVGTPIAAGASLDVMVALRPDGALSVAGNVRASFREAGLGNLGDPAQTLDVPLSGAGLAPCISVTPSEIDFGTVATGTSRTQPLTIASTCAAPLEVRGILVGAGTAGEFHVAHDVVPFVVAPGAAREVAVTVDPVNAGALFGTVEIASDDVDDPVVFVPLRANSAACGAPLSCTPSTVHFGEVPIGETLTRPVACTNVSDEPVTIAPHAPAPFVTTTTTSVTIQPGRTRIIDVAFTATNAGAVARTLALALTGPTGTGAPSCIPVTLSAVGVDDAPACPGALASFAPVEKWRFSLPGSDGQSWTTPIVARLEDTSGDHVVTRADTPRVIVATFDANDAPDINSDDPNAAIAGVLRALDGATGDEVWSSAVPVNSAVTPAVGDLDGDGSVEIVASAFTSLPGLEEFPGAPRTLGRYQRGHLVAFDAHGALVWRSDEWTRRFDELEDAGAPALGDVDGDGDLEIALSDHLFDHRGHLLWRGARAIGSAGRGPMSLLVDVDGAPGLELVAGRTVYRGADGSVLWNRDDLELYDEDGLVAVGDLDGDGDNEVVMRSASLWIMDGATGEALANPLLPPVAQSTGLECDANELVYPETCYPIPAPISLADLDGDGDAEIIVPNKDLLLAYRFDPDDAFVLREVLRVTAADASGASGASAFDFFGGGGDGGSASSQIVSVDEQWLTAWTLDDVLFYTEHASITAMETPTIADVDGDGHADVVVVQNDHAGGNGRGVVVWSDDSWPRARGIWSQHAFMDVLVDELGRPAAEQVVIERLRGAQSICD